MAFRKYAFRLDFNCDFRKVYVLSKKSPKMTVYTKKMLAIYEGGAILTLKITTVSFYCYTYKHTRIQVCLCGLAFMSPFAHVSCMNVCQFFCWGLKVSHTKDTQISRVYLQISFSFELKSKKTFYGILVQWRIYRGFFFHQHTLNHQHNIEIGIKLSNQYVITSLPTSPIRIPDWILVSYTS